VEPATAEELASAIDTARAGAPTIEQADRWERWLEQLAENGNTGPALAQVADTWVTGRYSPGY
jgi:hypothetical protein